jgi:glycosyltransferase involved in cell wall biosynthesis
MKTINILFYVPYLSQENGGIRQYAAGLLNLLSNFPNHYKFFVLHENSDPLILETIESNQNLILVKTDHFSISIQNRIFERICNIFIFVVNFLFRKNIKKRINDPLRKLVSNLNIDIIHCPYQFIPNLNDVRLICTLHDVQELHFPQFFNSEERAYRAVNYKKFIDKSDVVIVSYEHVKQDIVKFFQKNENDVQVVLLKMNNLWFKRFDMAHITKTDLKLPFDDFLFYPANMWLHKNHKNLIEAIKLLKDKHSIVNIVLSGDHNSENGEYIKELILQYNLQNQIKLVGILEESELFYLYRRSRGVVIPTLYEAGSFPLVESIFLGVPVICSNVTSLPETIGDDKFTFDPYQIENIAEKVEELWTNEAFRESSRQNCYMQQLSLIETNAEVALMAIYDNLIEN